MRVGIIGAGAAGLAAAYYLTKEGHYAEVFERAPFLGGQASTFPVGGGQLERGYHHLFVSDVDIVELIHELGLGDKLAWLESQVGLFHGGRVWDFSTPWDLLRFKPLPLVQRLRVGLWSLVLQKTTNWQKYESVTAQDWITRRMGKEAYQVIWEPLLRGKFGQNYDQISMTWLWGKFRLRVSSRQGILSRERLGYPMGSFGQVFDTLAERVRQMGGEVHVSASVEGIDVRDGRAHGLRVKLPDADVEYEKFDAVIATVPSHVFSRLVPALPPTLTKEYMARLGAARYMSAVLIVLVLDRPLSHVYWLNVADRSIPFVGVIEHTNFIGPEHYGGKHIVYLSNYLSADHPLYGMSHEELLQEYLPHLRKINPAFEPSWVLEYHHHRVDAAQPIIGVNYSQRIPDMRTPIKGLYLANTTQIYPEDRGTNYSVRMGKHVAHMVIKDFG